MGILQSIIQRVRRATGTSLARLPGQEVGLPSIPEHRRKLLFLSHEKPGMSGIGVSISLSSGAKAVSYGPAEPSCIYSLLPVTHKRFAPDAVPKLGYFPSYLGMTPAQREIYLNWLRDITSPIDIGYVFVYYYGLERHLVYGEFDAAVREILLLRQHHSNSSFQGYSAAALVHGCLLRLRGDTLRHLYLDVGLDYFGNSVLLLLHQQNLGLTPDLLMHLALKLRGVNKLYIKKKDPIYLQALRDELHQRFGEELYPFASHFDLSKIAGVPYPVFANISLPSDVRSPSLPNLLNDKGFQEEFESFFLAVHERAKTLRKARKQGKSLPHALLSDNRTG